MSNIITDKSVLATVNYPEDIRKLDLAQLNRLAGEIREKIIETVSRNGGHLASSLGTVELTLAIHCVFDTPKDKLIWDVGHQAYAHKIITGRKDIFHTLRKRGGISGFPRREESPYDVFNAGHSSTSISAAIGVTEAKCLTGGNFKTIAVIGDGSIAAGMAFEALNWAGDRNKDMIIILNDNEMCISPNVGAMSSYLNRVMTGHTVTKFKAEFKHFLQSIPSIGPQMVKFTKQVEDSLKALVIPGALFEELGFTYVGPLEGHRLDHLIKNLRNVKELKGPVLVHVITKKGMGYKFAEDDPAKFHGIAPFKVETGEPLDGDAAPLSYTRMFGKTIIKLAHNDSRIVAVTAAMSEGTGLDEFARVYPHRFYDVGMAEQHGVTFSAGLAAEGLIPVVAIYSTFLQRAYDQIVHDVCLQNLPVVFTLDRGGFVGSDGPTHHGLFDYSYLRSIPNITVMAPKDENELQHMLKTAVECGRPVSIRYPRGRGIGVAIDDLPVSLEIGNGEIVFEGENVALAIVAIGSTVYPAIAAAKKLKEKGISVRVINARFVKPLDEKLLCSTAHSFKRIITVEENVLMGGFGSAVLELFEQKGIRDAVVKRLGIRDEFVEHASQGELRKLYGIDEEGIMEAAQRMVENREHT
jgi:1-deoxy-D-xylulose-5-phosphate synthase